MRQKYGATSPAVAAGTSPEVKQAIAEELRQQIEAERAPAQTGSDGAAPVAPASEQVPGALDPRQRIFVVSTSLDVATSAGQNCALTGGDIPCAPATQS